jgi:hypothetical protein
MSLLQETHNQYADFSDTVSCLNLNAARAISSPLITTDALDAAVSISTATLNAASVVTAALQLTTAPVAGNVLTSDATGNASWQPVPANAAYGYTVGQSTITVAAGALFTFDLGTVVSNAGFTSVPAPAGSSYVIATAGVYEYSFYVAAEDGAGTTQALEIALVVNAAAGVAENIFRSGLAANATDPMVCVGRGLIALAAADVVSLQNITNSSTTPLSLTNVPAGGVAGANCTLSLRLIA